MPCTHLHSHDQAAGHVPHLVHHAVRSSAELADLLQVIGLHLEILKKRDEVKHGRSCEDPTTEHGNTTSQTENFSAGFKQKKKIFTLTLSQLEQRKIRNLCQRKIPLI